MLKRDMENVLKRQLEVNSFVLLLGVKGSGKTKLVRNAYPKYNYVSLEDLAERTMAVKDTAEFFARHAPPLIIDEIQLVPTLLNAVRSKTAENPESGQFILLASRRIQAGEFDSSQSCGNHSVIKLQPVSLRELSAVSNDIDRDTILLKGFMPAMYDDENPGFINPADFYRNYINSIIEHDILKMTSLHDLPRFMHFLTLLASRTGRIMNNSAIASEVGVSSTTIGTWVSILKDAEIIFPLEAFCPTDSSQIVKTPKLYFTDAALAASLLGIETVQQMMRDPLMPRLFENMVVADAMKYCSDFNHSLSFFKNSNNRQIDLIIHNKDSERPEIVEIHSGRTPDESFHRNIRNFTAHNFPSAKGRFGTVIYSGQDYSSFSGVRYLHFQHLHTIFGAVDG